MTRLGVALISVFLLGQCFLGCKGYESKNYRKTKNSEFNPTKTYPSQFERNSGVPSFPGSPTDEQETHGGNLVVENLSHIKNFLILDLVSTTPNARLPGVQETKSLLEFQRACEIKTVTKPITAQRLATDVWIALSLNGDCEILVYPNLEFILNNMNLTNYSLLYYNLSKYLIHEAIHYLHRNNTDFSHPKGDDEGMSWQVVDEMLDQYIIINGYNATNLKSVISAKYEGLAAKPNCDQSQLPKVQLLSTETGSEMRVQLGLPHERIVALSYYLIEDEEYSLIHYDSGMFERDQWIRRSLPSAVESTLREDREFDVGLNVEVDDCVYFGIDL